jgi:hypothetical protein
MPTFLNMSGFIVVPTLNITILRKDVCSSYLVSSSKGARLQPMFFP